MRGKLWRGRPAAIGAPRPGPARVDPGFSVRSMAKLRVLFIGGSGGIISSACSRVAIDSGIELFVLNRGRSAVRAAPAGG